MQQSKSITRIESKGRKDPLPPEAALCEHRKGAKFNKTKRGGGYKGNFFSTNPNKFDPNLMVG